MPIQRPQALYTAAALAAIALLALAVNALLPASPAAAHDVVHGSLEIGNPWARAMPDGAKVGGGYLSVTNRGDEADRLVGASAPFAARVEVHEMSMQDDVMKMRALPNGLAIPPGETVALEPGGLHIMFMGVTDPLVEGDRRRVTLTFEKAGPITVEFVVEGMAARGHGDHQMDGVDHDTE